MNDKMDNYLRACLQAIRLVNLACHHHKLEWTLHGEFLRLLLAHTGQQGDEPLQEAPLELKIVFPTSVMLGIDGYSTSHRCTMVFTQVLTELEIIGAVCKPTTELVRENGGFFPQGKPIHVPLSVLGLNITMIATLHLANGSVGSLYMTSDALELRQHIGLTAVMPHPELDRLNRCIGITTLECIMELRCGRVRQLEQYCACDTLELREHNVQLLLRHVQCMSEGFVVEGNAISQIDRASHEWSCPICLDTFESSDSVVLVCGHAFCIQCLVKHLHQRGVSHGQCPLCRASILLKTQNMTSED
jgi:hypothetical protein